jgi:Tfp pilus assembly protein PilN
VLAGLLLLVGGAMAAHSAIADRKYRQELETEIARLEPEARKAAALDRQIEQARTRARLLDEFRGHTRVDLEALNEVTRLLPAPAWTNLLELNRDAANISGEAEHAAVLLKELDASPYFQNSEFSGIQRTGSVETFRIHTVREKRP